MTIKDRLARLSDVDYCFSEEHVGLLWHGAGQGEFSLAGARFVAAFVKKAAAIKVPLYSLPLDVTTVEVLHAQWRYSLPALDWAILGHLGKEAAKMAEVSVVWAPEVEAGIGPLDDPLLRHLPSRWALL